MSEFIRKAWQWIGGDGVQHFAVSAIIVFMLGGVLPVWIAALAALLCGIAKEVWDLARNGWDVRTYDWKHSGHDLICDCAGIVFGLLVCLLWLYIKTK